MENSFNYLVNKRLESLSIGSLVGPALQPTTAAMSTCQTLVVWSKDMSQDLGSVQVADLSVHQ